MSQYNIYDTKIDDLFKYLFGSEENVDCAKSLINAVLPENENVEELEFRSTEINTVSVSKNRRRIVVDIYAFDKKNQINVLIEMEARDKRDVIGRAELTSSRIIDSLYTAREAIDLKQKIYSVNFLYFDLYPSDGDYYHHLYLHQDKKPNIRSNFRDVIIIELKKFQNQFTKEEMEVLSNQINNTDPSIIDKKTKRLLWFYCLSSVNRVYKEPRGDTVKYFSIQIENGNFVYIKNEIDYEFLKKLIKVKEIKKVLQICAKPPNEDKIKKNL